MAGIDEEPVIAPDQLKPARRKPVYIGAIFAIILLLLMTLGNHKGRIEDLWLIGIATVIAAGLVVDWLLRKNGLKSNV